MLLALEFSSAVLLAVTALVLLGSVYQHLNLITTLVVLAGGTVLGTSLFIGHPIIAVAADIACALYYAILLASKVYRKTIGTHVCSREPYKT
jgi:hypothetical protein